MTIGPHERNETRTLTMMTIVRRTKPQSMFSEMRHCMGIIAALGCIAWIQPLFAADESMWAFGPTQPVPEGASVTLEFDRPSYFLGENVLVHFILENTSDESFEASWGADYEGASRHLRFKITAMDEAGNLAEDPDPSQNCFGGIGGPHRLGPGEKFVTSLPLMRSCDIKEPGRYTIRATHDFGWKEGERKRPVGEATITFLLPDAAEAERIVAQMERLPTDPDASFGKRSRNYADFSCLRHPVYLEPLARRARTGDFRVFHGLGLMATLEATQTLIQLANDADSKLALEAAQTLNARLPIPESKRLVPASGRFEIRRRLAKQAWDTKFAPEVRALAARFLAKKEVPEIACGASMMDAVGTPDDAPAVLASLDRALDTFPRPRNDPKDNILDLPSPIRELLSTMRSLRSRGFTLGESVAGSGLILLYFEWLANEPQPRPARWREMLDAFGAATQYPIRLAALRSIPRPIPATCREYILQRLADPDLGVCRAACTIAGESGNGEYLKPLLEIIATEHHEWLLREAGNAATKLNAGFDLLEVWADRLNEDGLYQIALDTLGTVLEVPRGNHSGRTDLTRAERLDLRERWKGFLAQHADEIRGGKRFKVSDPAVTPALVGRARQWQLPDGTSWPSSTQENVSN